MLQRTRSQSSTSFFFYVLSTFVILFALSSSVSGFVILDPWTGRVKVDLAEASPVDNETDPNAAVEFEARQGSVLPLARDFEATEEGGGNKDNEEFISSEYVSSNGQPKYKIYKKYPYSHGRK